MGSGVSRWRRMRTGVNQAHLFHISALEASERESLIANLGTENVPRNAFYGTENVPRNAFYGDGSPIEADVLEHIRDAYAQEKTHFTWQRGDMMKLGPVRA